MTGHHVLATAEEQWNNRRAIAERLGCDPLDLQLGNYGQDMRLDGRVVARRGKAGWFEVMEGPLERA